MESLKKLSTDILDKGIPDMVIAELIDRCPKTVYISVGCYSRWYNIYYVNALSKYYIQRTHSVEGLNPPTVVPNLLMDSEGLLVFVEYFCGFGLTANKRQQVHLLETEYFTHSREGFIKAMRLLQGTYEVS